jgi:hypothetical protein
VWLALFPPKDKQQNPQNSGAEFVDSDVPF